MHPDRIFVLGDPPQYEPGPERSATAIAAARGVDPWELLLELLLVDGGRELLNAPVLNYTDGNLDAVGEMLRHPTSAFGLGDGGAHAGPDVRRLHDHLPADPLGPGPSRGTGSRSRTPCTR